MVKPEIKIMVKSEIKIMVKPEVKTMVKPKIKTTVKTRDKDNGKTRDKTDRSKWKTTGKKQRARPSMESGKVFLNATFKRVLGVEAKRSKQTSHTFRRKKILPYLQSNNRSAVR